MKNTTPILFNAPVSLKQAAIKRAKKFDMTLTDVLTEALEAFVAGGVDPEPLSKAERASIKKSAREIARGQTVPLEKLLKKHSIR